MSEGMSQDGVLFYQSLLKAEGLYSGVSDGKIIWGHVFICDFLGTPNH